MALQSEQDERLRVSQALEITAFNKRSIDPKTKASLEHLQHMNELKLGVLENWEATKRKVIEKLVNAIDELRELEERAERDEKELENERNASKRFCGEAPIDLSKPTKNKDETPPSTPSSSNVSPSARWPFLKGASDDMVTIGPNGTTVSRSALNAINWSQSAQAVTRKLLVEVFDRKTLASHTLTGRPSPAFLDCNKPEKGQLDPRKVADVVHVITKHFKITPRDVRSVITIKCADENKTLRQRRTRWLSFDNLKRKTRSSDK